MPRQKNGKFAKKSIAQKVRDLDAKGLSRSEIAKKLDIRYQRVRNVLVPRVTADSTESTETESVEAEAESAELEPATAE